MSRVYITAGRIGKLALQEGSDQSFLWDTDTKQLAVRVTSGGKKKSRSRPSFSRAVSTARAYASQLVQSMTGALRMREKKLVVSSE